MSVFDRAMSKCSWQTFKCVDSHTCGEPTRVLVEGCPDLQGNTVAEKRQDFIKRFDWIRQSLMYEPRGHSDMFGAILVPPSDKNADIGVIFMDHKHYLTMCGHGTFGVITVCLNLGIIEKNFPITKVVVETPAGLVHGQANLEEGTVTIRNVNAFLFKKDIKLKLPEYSDPIYADVSYGGNFFAIIDSSSLSEEITKNRETKSFSQLGKKIRNIINEQENIIHPQYPHIKDVSCVAFYDKKAVPKEIDADVYYRNVVTFGNGQVDRSPCGTGTCAKLAQLYGRGKINASEKLCNESVIGTRFYGEIQSQVEIEDFKGIVPIISGKASVTGYSTFVIDPNDVLKNGFVLD